MNGVAFCLVGIPPRPEPRPPQVRGSARRGADPGAAGVAGPCKGWLAAGVPCGGHRGHRFGVPGTGAEASGLALGKGQGGLEGGSGPGRWSGRLGIAGPPWATAGAAGPRLLSAFFRRGARRCFLCPSFRFPLARPRHSWREREWGKGFPEREVLGHCGRTPPLDTLPSFHTHPLPGRPRDRLPSSISPPRPGEEERNRPLYPHQGPCQLIYPS